MSLRKTSVTSLFISLALALVACGGGSHTPPTGNAPNISAQPSSRNVTVGQTATFTVAASGTSPLNYQWVKGTNWIAGATTSSYTTPATTMQDNGTQFHVIVSNAVGSVNSSTVSLTVSAGGTAPTITQQPANQTVNTGQTATFSVTASGTAPLSYQWQKGTTNISGATSSSYTTPATTSADNNTQYRVVISNSAGNVTSNAATLTVTSTPVGPSITQQPANKTVTVGQTATFSVVATGTAPLSYQWQKGTTDIAGATSSSYTTPATVIGDNSTQFRVVVSNSVTSVTSNAATLTVNAPVAPSITQQPADKSVSAGQTATFTVTATGTAPLSYQWKKGTTNITNATSASYTTPPTTLADSGSQFSVVVTNTAGNATSNAATLTVTAAVAGVDVLTYHNDIARTGANLSETILTTTNVASATFGKIGNYSVDAKVDAQPLYAANVAIPSNGTHNLLIVVTENDSVYAFDADTGTIVWQKSMLQSGETASDDRGCSQVSPKMGITSTPVIDRTQGANGAIYLVAMSKASAYHQRLHALDLATGAELFSGPKEITASFPGTGDNTDGTNVIFDPKQYKERMGLLLMNGVIYTAWASHCDFSPYTAWVMGHNADTLAPTSVLNVVPNGSLGAFWAAGGGVAADPQGNIYLLSGNGDFGTSLDGNGFPSNKNFGNGFLKISTTGGNLAVADYFEMSNTVSETSADQDLGSGGAMVLPDFTDGSGATQHLVVGAGKDAHIYLLNRNNMGKFNSSSNNIYQDIPNALSGGIWSVPAYFNNHVYYGPVGNHLLSFTVTNAKLSTSPDAQSNNSFAYPGTSPSVSANGSSNGIVWAVENSGATLHAYDASNMNELYNSNQAANNRDHFGGGNKFITPTIVNGKVFVGTQNSVAVFGLLP